MKTTTSGSDAATIDWLLDGDPAIRWQALHDVVGAPRRTVDRERARVAADGWGARLLAQQGRSGRWGGGRASDAGLYTPKWTSTTYTLLLLRDFGLDPTNERARTGATLLLDYGLQPDGGINYGASAKRWRAGETCVTGMTLSLLSYFAIDDERLDAVASHLLAKQMADGGWNCRRVATHSSVNTTISALEGLALYERHRGNRSSAVRAAQKRGREFLLEHRLFRSHRTGKVMKSEFTRFVFPPRWHYDVLRALDHFRAVGASRDPRLEDAIALVRKRRGPDGRWPLDGEYKGATYFRLESVRAPSRWNTLRALRVLRWWGDGPSS